MARRDVDDGVETGDRIDLDDLRLAVFADRDDREVEGADRRGRGLNAIPTDRNPT